MKGGARFSGMVSLIGTCMVFLSASIFLWLQSRKSEASPRVVLEVLNKHFTVGLKIPSVYLRVFSDGRAECYTVRYTGEEPNVVKKKALTPDELGKLEAILDNQDLLNVNKRYGLVDPVIDSWMEWNIAVPHKIATQKIQVLNFSPGSAGEKNKPYPDALVKLGCHIWKLRFEIYGDETYGNRPYYLTDGCKNAFASPD